MALRLHQSGRGERRDLIVCLYVHPRYVADVARQHPACVVVYDTATPTSRYRATGYGGIDTLPLTVAWALEESRALAIGRVVVVGYSAGCMGVRAILGDAAAGPDGWPDAVVAVDGIHSSRPPTRWQLDVWQPYLDACRASERVMVTSCTQILPPTFSSTRETLSAVTGYALPKLGDDDEPVTLGEGQLRVHVHPGKGRTAHEEQASDYLADMVAEAMAMLGPPAEEPLGPPDTERAPVLPWQDPALSGGERALAWTLAELEAYPGSLETEGANAGPRIALYHACAERPPGTRLGIRRGPWCASGASYAMLQGLLPGEDWPHVPRCSGIELWQDACRAGTARPAQLVRDGSWLPEPGDLVILKRGAGWERHACRVSVAPTPTDMAYQTADGNHGDRWALVDRDVGDDELIGFLEQPRVVAGLAAWRAAELYELSRGAMLGERSMETIMAELDEREGRE